MSNSDYHAPHDATLLPWQVIGEFLVLSEILTLRLVSQEICESIHEISPQKCGALLEKALQENNMHLVSEGLWTQPFQDQASLASMIIRDVHELTTPLDSVFRCLRVLKSIPMEVAVAFNAKYGRHCIPLEWNSETNQAEPKLYPKCTRKDCPTCKLRIPTDKGSTAKIHTHIQIQNKRGKPRDLEHFYNKCVPNLPADLICPSCRCRDKRTLALSTLSYSSSAPGGRNPLLTYTPQSNDESDGKTPQDEEDEDVAEAQPKKQRLLDKDDFAFPSIVQDLALPTKWEPLEYTPETTKHAIAIHCVSCRQFGMVAPAGPCCDDRFPCHERTRQVNVLGRTTTVGGVFVRRQCSTQDCLHPVYCEACSRQVNHPQHDRDVAARNAETVFDPPVVTHKTRCLTCNLRFCRDCAWQSTICHHW